MTFGGELTSPEPKLAIFFNCQTVCHIVKGIPMMPLLGNPLVEAIMT